MRTESEVLEYSASTLERRMRLVSFVTVILVASDTLVAAGVLASAGRDVAAVFSGVLVATTAGSGGYRVSLRGRVAEQCPALVARVAIAAALTSAFAEPGHGVISRRAGVVVIGCLVMRALLFAFVRRGRTRGVRASGTVIVGAGSVALELADRMRDHPEFGLQLVGLVDDVDEDLPFPVLGRVRELPEILERHPVQVLIVAFGAARESDLVPLLRACERQDVEFYIVPRMFELGVAGVAVADDELWGIPLRRLCRATLRPAAWRTKRAFDIAVASILTLLLAPVMVAVAAAVRLSSEGPIFFRQERVGQRGRPFHVLKFRSMMVNDDSSSTWDVTNDARVTRVGRVIRETSLDELPQLFNVLRGDMSLVGPRPERPGFVEEFTASVPGYADRHRVPVGMTGLAQVNGLRGNTSIKERALFDNMYIEHWSLWGDIVILVRTALAVVRPPASVYVHVADPAPPDIDLTDHGLALSRTRS